jgi:dihydroflavonol-4-reductase
MKILVIGATGFIGGHLVRRFVENGADIRCLVRNPAKLDPEIRNKVELMVGDVTDFDSVQLALADCDVVVHLANVYSMWLPDRTEFKRVNEVGTYNVMKAASTHKAIKMIYVSTVAVYGKPEDRPFFEDSPKGKRLFSDYAKSKAAADRIADEFNANGLSLVTLYPGIVLGAGDENASGVYIRDVINGDVPSIIFPRSTATYICVEDVVTAIATCIQRDDLNGEKFLLGGRVMNGNEYARLISKMAGVKLPLFPYPDFVVIIAAYLLTALAHFTGRTPRWGLSVDAAWTMKHGFVFDGSKAEKVLGIQYTPIETAIHGEIAYYRGKASK